MHLKAITFISEAPSKPLVTSCRVQVEIPA